MGVEEPDWRSKEGTVYRQSLKMIAKAADVSRTLSTIYIQYLKTYFKVEGMTSKIIFEYY